MNTTKIWGERQRLLLTAHSEIDLLHLRANSFCSYHCHEHKVNHFTVIDGKVRIDFGMDYRILNKNQTFEIHPGMNHRFFVLEPSTMIEIAYTTTTIINPKDIYRIKQGGRVISGVEFSENEIIKRGLENEC